MFLSVNELTAELIIPSYNRLAVLKRTLQRIRVLYPELQICLGLQGEMPDSQWRSELQKDQRLRIETLSSPSITRTLNHCIATSRSEIILLLDDDAVPHFGWLEAHLRAFTENLQLAYTSGRIMEFNKGRSAHSEYTRIHTEWLFGLFLGAEKKINGRIVGWINKLGLILSNYDRPGSCMINSPREGNMGIRRDNFLRMGGFNTDFRGNAWGFGAEYGVRLARTGQFGRYVGDAIVIHYEFRTGGTRAQVNEQWFNDFLHNHKVLISHLGPQAWLGALPRLIKKRFFN